MDAERARAFLLSLPHVVETQQWGDNLVFWVGDKAIGGKMFALLDLAGGLAHGVAMYAAGPERFHALLEMDGLKPAPYMARIFWVAAERWGALRGVQWEEEFRAAHAITLAKLPRRTREVLAMPERERNRLVAERRKLLAAKAKASRPKAIQPSKNTKPNKATKAQGRPDRLRLVGEDAREVGPIAIDQHMKKRPSSMRQTS
jgi:predicted DNA-binding protein (MmcQ/YjbR family)